MDSRGLYELLLIVLTLHFVTSNQGWQKTECLSTIQRDAYHLIKPHVEKHGLSCAKIKYVRRNSTCIFHWTLAGSCSELQEIQQMIRESSKKCAYNPTRPSARNCSKESFLTCWCGFISKNF